MSSDYTYGQSAPTSAMGGCGLHVWASQYRITRAVWPRLLQVPATPAPPPVAAPLPEAAVAEHSTVVVDLDNLKPGD